MEAKAAYEAEKSPYVTTNRDAVNLSDFYAMKDKMDQWTRRIRPLTAALERYERWAMRHHVKRVDAFLLPPDGVHRTIQKLRLQTFGRKWNQFIQRWVTAAIARWGVEDFELNVEGRCIAYDFKILDGCQNLQLKRLVLFNCPPLGSFNSLTFQRLTRLSLCKTSYFGLANRILTHCVHLLDFSIRYCPGYWAGGLRINVPTSRLKNLLVDNCKFGKIYLHSLPCLETFACRGLLPSKIYYGEVPGLRHVGLDYLKTEGDSKVDPSVSNRTYPLSKFLKRIPPIESLVLQFKGPEVWIEPIAVPDPLLHLKKLFIANVPINWDIFWIVTLLDAAPVLESCHVHIDNRSENMASWLDVQAQDRQYHCLKELVVVGFNAVGWQIGFVRHVMKASPRMRQVHLLDGHVVEDKERVLEGLEVVPHTREWHEFERSEVLDDLWDGNGICSPQLEIILE
ncbi:hypothetical protein OsI_10082 [Oryza sativa Indica Group]|uniref:At1g61320/AtMIF1 LRR domain-containing protein n=1 Tax=Oryza sativa subsp. indica TaxID=39946 RepID=A2XCP7_ORYSI|nr:hypothetical protein OsI_10082 [Oryza sativa Indica Group]